MVDFLLVLIALFCKLSRLRRNKRILVEIVVFEMGWVTLSANFRRDGGSSTNDFWHQKTKLPGLSCGIGCVILCFAMLIQYRRVSDTQTYTR